MRLLPVRHQCDLSPILGASRAALASPGGVYKKTRFQENRKCSGKCVFSLCRTSNLLLAPKTFRRPVKRFVGQVQASDVI